MTKHVEISRAGESTVVDRSTYDLEHRQQGWSIVRSVPGPVDESYIPHAEGSKRPADIADEILAGTADEFGFDITVNDASDD